MLMGYNWIQAVIFVIGIIVANVPEVSEFVHYLDKSFMFVTATGSTDHSDDHVDPDCTADGQEELPGEESGGRGDLGLH